MTTKENVKNVKNISKKQESKAEIFLRLATIRTQKVLKAIRILGNCSNRNNYEYTNEQTTKIFESIHNTLDNIQAKFTQSKQEVESFKL